MTRKGPEICFIHSCKLSDVRSKTDELISRESGYWGLKQHLWWCENENISLVRKFGSLIGILQWLCFRCTCCFMNLIYRRKKKLKRILTLNTGKVRRWRDERVPWLPRTFFRDESCKGCPDCWLFSQEHLDDVQNQMAVGTVGSQGATRTHKKGNKSTDPIPKAFGYNSHI